MSTLFILPQDILSELGVGDLEHERVIPGMGLHVVPRVAELAENGEDEKTGPWPASRHLARYHMAQSSC